MSENIVKTPESISVSEAAFIAGVSGETIRQWAAKIDGLGMKVVGRWSIRRANLNVLLAVGAEKYLERLAAARADRQMRQLIQESQELQPRDG